MRFDKELAERLERYTADTGVTQVRVQTEALNAYLTVKGY